MKQKPIIYYDNMLPPTYIRLVSERLNLDHIVCTDATDRPLGYLDICKLADTKLFDKILVCVCGTSHSCNSLYIRHPKGSVPSTEEISYLNDDWINVFNVILVDSNSDKELFL